jgi:hypothetical protein
MAEPQYFKDEPISHPLVLHPINQSNRNKVSQHRNMRYDEYEAKVEDITALFRIESVEDRQFFWDKMHLKWQYIPSVYQVNETNYGVLFGDTKEYVYVNDRIGNVLQELGVHVITREELLGITGLYELQY